MKHFWLLTIVAVLLGFTAQAGQVSKPTGLKRTTDTLSYTAQGSSTPSPQTRQLPGATQPAKLPLKR